MSLPPKCRFGTTVNSAHWDESTKRWTVGSKEGTTFRARYLIWCTGYFTKRYVPDIPGLASFKGPCLHTGSWPSEGVNLSGKRVGIIGTGASAVQLIQDIAPLVKHLTVFQRTPNTALPMVQRKLPEGGHDKKTYQAAFHRLRETTSGFLYSPKDQSALDATPEEREAFFQSLYDIGGFAYYLGSYNDIMTSIGMFPLFHLTFKLDRSSTDYGIGDGKQNPTTSRTTFGSAAFASESRIPRLPNCWHPKFLFIALVQNVLASSRGTTRSTIRRTSIWWTCEWIRLSVSRRLAFAPSQVCTNSMLL